VEEVKLKVEDDPFPNEAVELAVMSMRHGEEAEVSVNDAHYAFGAAGLEGKVPANELVSYYINLHSFTNGPDHWDLNPAQKIEMAEGLKRRGNQAMKAANLGRARRMYEKVGNMLSMDNDFSEEEKAASRDLQVSVSLNIAAAALKQGKHRDCIAECNKVLEKRSGNVKALYRRSQAYLEQGDMLEAETDLKNALLSDPESKELAAALKRLKARMREANKKDAKLFGAMFSKVGKMYEDVKVTHSSGAIAEPGLEVPEGAKGEDVDTPDAPKTVDGEGDAIMQPMDAENVSGNV
jgi:FK506-binding protein 4/5